MADDVVVIDGFYRDPDAVRTFALSLEYAEPHPRANFPGRESIRPWFSSAHLDRFAELIGVPLVCDPSRWVFGKFRISQRSDAMRTTVHVDHVNWTAVVYLANSGVVSGGLGIFRHLGLGLDRVPEPADLGRLGCVDMVDFDRRYVFPVSTEMDQWQEIERIDIKYNRLVLFRGERLFHGITDLFGGTAADGRLTQNFFMQEGSSLDAATVHGSPTSQEGA